MFITIYYSDKIVKYKVLNHYVIKLDSSLTCFAEDREFSRSRLKTTLVS